MRAASLLRHAMRTPAEGAAPYPDLVEFLDGIPACIGWTSNDMRYRFVNRAYEAWFGRPRETIHGRHLIDILGREAFAVMLPYVTRALAGERATVTTTLPMKDREPRYVTIRLLPRRDRDARVDGYLAMVERAGKIP